MRRSSRLRGPTSTSSRRAAGGRRVSGLRGARVVARLRGVPAEVEVAAALVERAQLARVDARRVARAALRRAVVGAPDDGVGARELDVDLAQPREALVEERALDGRAFALLIDERVRRLVDER